MRDSENPVGTSPGLLFRHAAILLLFVGMVTGCSQAPESERAAASDSTSIEAAVVVDSAAAATVADSTVALAQASRADTVTSVSSRLDSLLRHVARLEAAVLARTDTDATANSQPADTSGQSLRPREQLRETAEDVSNFGLRTFWAIVVALVGSVLVLPSLLILWDRWHRNRGHSVVDEATVKDVFEGVPGA